MDYILTHWKTFAHFLGDHRVDLSNNAAERAPPGIAIGRKAWVFGGSDRGGERMAVIDSLITTAKPNDVDPHAWLAAALARINDHPASRPLAPPPMELEGQTPTSRSLIASSAALA